MSDSYDKLKNKYPDWNWEGADEASPEDLEAAAEYFDRLVFEIRKKSLT